MANSETIFVPPTAVPIFPSDDDPRLLSIAGELGISPRVAEQRCVYYEKQIMVWHSATRRVCLEGFPGNCGMMIMHQLYDLHLVPALESLARAQAENLGYSRILATHIQDAWSADILKQRGWREFPELRFTNKRTGNKIVVLGIDLASA